MNTNKKRNSAASVAEPTAPSKKQKTVLPSRPKIKVGRGKARPSSAAAQLKATEREFEKAFPVTEGTLAKLVQEVLDDVQEGRTVELDPDNL